VHVLVAEDQEMVRVALVRILTRLGCIVTAASGGREAATVFMRTERITAVVSDFDMNGGGNGRELYEAIRDELKARNGRFMIVTGDMPHFDREWFEEQGVPVIWKPVLPDDLKRFLS